MAPVAQAAGKALLNDLATEGYTRARELVALLQSSDDFQEGIEAFKAKRKPRFRGS